jgi:nicotinamide mononucleotide adenylyltransferase
MHALMEVALAIASLPGLTQPSSPTTHGPLCVHPRTLSPRTSSVVVVSFVFFQFSLPPSLHSSFPPLFTNRLLNLFAFTFFHSRVHTPFSLLSALPSMKRVKYEQRWRERLKAVLFVDCFIPDAARARALVQYSNGDPTPLYHHLLTQDKWLNQLLSELHLSRQCRYITRPPTYNMIRRNVVTELEEGTEDFYKTHMRMTSESFSKLLRLIFQHGIFRNRSNRKQEEIAAQLAVTLDRLGHYGNGMSSLRNARLWDRSSGSLRNYFDRGIKAILSLEQQYLSWPTPEERRAHSEYMAQLGFPGCIGFVDGTTIKFEQRPGHHGDYFHDRHDDYSLNIQVICDATRKILFVFTGFSGRILYFQITTKKKEKKNLQRELICTLPFRTEPRPQGFLSVGRLEISRPVFLSWRIPHRRFCLPNLQSHCSFFQRSCQHHPGRDRLQHLHCTCSSMQ